MSAISRVSAPPAWPQDTKGKFPFISTSTALGLFLPPLSGDHKGRETERPGFRDPQSVGTDN